jgi:hypothetical protein
MMALFIVFAIVCVIFVIGDPRPENDDPDGPHPICWWCMVIRIAIVVPLLWFVFQLLPEK